MKQHVYHGGDLKNVKARYPEVKEHWIDLSTGLNPVPYPWQSKVPDEKLLEAAARLPQTTQLEECVEAWGSYLGATGGENWLLTSGSQAVINILPHLLPGYQAVIAVPNYGEHARVWAPNERPTIFLNREDIEIYEPEEKQILLLTSPNNPDGYCWPKDVLLQLANRLLNKQGYLLVDEAFGDLAPKQSMVTEAMPPNIILLRSFGKFFGLAGVRLGFVCMPETLKAGAIERLGPWAVNGMAATIGAYALRDHVWIRETRERLRANARTFRTILTDSGFKIIGGTDLFCLAEHTDAVNITHRLNTRAIHVRRFDYSPNWIRFGLAANEDDYDRLREALDDK